jgi:hypothetical protein
MRHVETMKGRGAIISSSGEHAPVRYELQVYQSEVPAGSMSDPWAKFQAYRSVTAPCSPLLSMETRV